MPTRLIVPQNSSDELLNLSQLIMEDGAQLLGLTAGQFSLLLFGILLPGATIMFLTSASLALTRRKASRIVAMILLTIGCLCLAAFIALSAYAVICGQNWAHRQL